MVHTTQQLLVFLKCDFNKVNDRVDHSILWNVLENIGFNVKAMELIKDLVEQTQPKVHINGQFIEPIHLHTGIRQGYPIWYLLFALLTMEGINIHQPVNTNWVTIVALEFVGVNRSAPSYVSH